jgi:phosphate transport system substrate-binding protein
MEGKKFGLAIVVILAIVIGAAVFLLHGSNSSVVNTGGNATATTTTSPTTSTTTPITATTTSATTSIILTGAGSTFVYPMMSVWIPIYESENPNVQINYAAVGSGTGISDLKSDLVDFGATDVPLGAGGAALIPGVITIPETTGAVTIAYNLPGIGSGLHLTGSVLANIFDENITMWNDPQIQALNENITLPSQPIVTVHRSDGSGTTFVTTSYLSLSSPTFENEIGAGKIVQWPSGSLGESGNTGVASTVASTKYSIGYVELAYALQENMTVAAVENPAGNWILPSLSSTGIAVQSAAATTPLPSGSGIWENVSLLNAPDPQAYPIVTFTYILVYENLNTIPGMTQAQATGLVQFLWWLVHDGQGYTETPALDYAQLPANVVAIDENSIQSLTFNGQTLPTS